MSSPAIQERCRTTFTILKEAFPVGRLFGQCLHWFMLSPAVTVLLRGAAVGDFAVLGVEADSSGAISKCEGSRTMAKASENVSHPVLGTIGWLPDYSHWYTQYQLPSREWLDVIIDPVRGTAMPSLRKRPGYFTGPWRTSGGSSGRPSRPNCWSCTTTPGGRGTHRH